MKSLSFTIPEFLAAIKTHLILPVSWIFLLIIFLSFSLATLQTILIPAAYQAQATLLITIPESAITDPTFPLSDYIRIQWQKRLDSSDFRRRMIKDLLAYERDYARISEAEAANLWSEQLVLSSSGQAGAITVYTRSSDQAAAVLLLRRFLDYVPELQTETVSLGQARFTLISEPQLNLLPITLSWSERLVRSFIYLNALIWSAVFTLAVFKLVYANHQ